MRQDEHLAPQPPNGEALLPVQYRGVSLAVRGKVRCVQFGPLPEEIEEVKHLADLEEIEEFELPRAGNSWIGGWNQ